MKCIALFATVLLVAIAVNGAQSAAARYQSEDVDDQEDTVLPRKFFDKLSHLNGDSKGGNKEIIVVYVKADKKHKKPSHGGGGGGGHHGHDDDGDFEVIKKRRPQHWDFDSDSHEYDHHHSDEYEYVRPHKHNNKKKVIIATGSGHTSTSSDSKWGSGSNSWKEWLNDKFGNKFNKDSGHGDDDETEYTYIIKKNKGSSHGGRGSHEHNDDSYESGHKWSKYD